MKLRPDVRHAISRETISVYTRSDLLVFLSWNKNNLSSVSFHFSFLRDCFTSAAGIQEFCRVSDVVVRLRRRFHFFACLLQTLKDVGRVRFIK